MSELKHTRSYLSDLEDYVINDEDILIVEEYIRKHLQDPSKDMSKTEFQTAVFSRTAIDDILNRMCIYANEFPHPWGDDMYHLLLSPYEIIYSYIHEMDNFAEEASNAYQVFMFNTCADAAEGLLNYFIDKGGVGEISTD